MPHIDLFIPKRPLWHPCTCMLLFCPFGAVLRLPFRSFARTPSAAPSRSPHRSPIVRLSLFWAHHTPPIDSSCSMGLCIVCCCRHSFCEVVPHEDFVNWVRKHQAKKTWLVGFVWCDSQVGKIVIWQTCFSFSTSWFHMLGEHMKCADVLCVLVNRE